MRDLTWLVSVLLAGEVSAAELSSASLKVTVDESRKGAVTAIVSMGGAVFANSNTAEPLFWLRASEALGKPMALTPDTAKRFTLRKDDPQKLELVYEDFGQGIRRVTCTIRAVKGEACLRWGITIEPLPGWMIEHISYPCFGLLPTLGKAVIGATKGGIIHQPGAQKPGWQVGFEQPGSLAAGFGCCYDDSAGFYTAAEDSLGEPKAVLLKRTAAGLSFEWLRGNLAAGQTEAQPYEIVTAAFSGDWHAAADLYKAWALKQKWCAKRLTARGDLPAWMRDAPAMVRFYRGWLAHPKSITDWLENYWKAKFPKAPLLTAYWGWEKHGDWVAPDYFPVYPSEEAFADLIRKTRAMGCHAFPWPSGYHWTLMYNKQPDGSFAWDDRSRFETVGRAHAVVNRDGNMYVRTPFWLNGGDTACLCGGDPWTLRWWNEEICLPLTRLGCEMIQIDQVVGGSFPACYAKNHPHKPGNGLWKTECFRKQLVTMRETMRSVQPESVVCFEEPDEWFNDLIGIQDYRDCESPYEWASVFNYLYHEFVPCFQSNPVRSDRVWIAHCLADGQIPHLVPAFLDIGKDCLLNRGFEGERGWEKVTGCAGQVWNGHETYDREERHSGTVSLRLDNRPNETVQVSQNIEVGSTNLQPGKRYRLSAWMKTGRMAQKNSIRFGVFAPELQHLNAGGTLLFPQAGQGWQKASAEFTMPEGAEIIRIMIHVEGQARAWVDDFELAEVSGAPVLATGDAGLTHLMARWVELYHGEGRDWLAHGRLAHPPKLECARQKHGNREVPAVFHNAFVAEDGREAIVLANATLQPQPVTLEWKGKRRSLTVEANDAVLLR